MATMQRLGSTATRIVPVLGQHGSGFSVYYHSTPVVTKYDNGRIELHHGGWMSAITKTRMNQASNQFGLGFNVFQKDYEWFVGIDGHVIDFDRSPLVVRNGHD